MSSKKPHDVTLELESSLNESKTESMPIVANRITTSEALFAGTRELVIDHAGKEYRLSLTNQGKLILTK